jgi:putative DNA primase/helicase
MKGYQVTQETPPGYTSGQVEILARRAIDLDTAQAAGVRSVLTEADLPEGSPEYWTTHQDTDGRAYLPGLLFAWRSPGTDDVEWQLRPDRPPLGDDGRPKKYVFRKGAASRVHAARPIEDPELVLITEGTCQTLAAARYAPDKVAVYGIAGCQSWVTHGVPVADLAVVEGHTVLVALDADGATNREVYDAGIKLREALLVEGATSVRFVRVPGGAKAGLDDVLGGQPVGRRSKYLGNLIERTSELPKADKPDAPAKSRPAAKKPEPTDGLYFGDGGLQVRTLAVDIAEHHPAALSAEDKVAVYRDGVYVLDGTGVLSAVTERLGEAFRVNHASNVERFMVGELARAGRRLPTRTTDPVVNLANGMLDLRTLELRPHSPDYLSSVQLPVEWHPEAKAPVYEAWLAQQAGDQADDLEETASLMLDPSRTPTKALFLFGPARSGKSTFLRLLQAVAGATNTSAVTLHQLSDDRFAAANVYGKVLNVAGDLSAGHVDDLSMFKRLTGEDAIQANRKYGGQFVFTNGALFAFSANELPTVGENSRAYAERVKPFMFGRSFAGAEDPTLETAMLAELPGILARWVAAYRRRVERGAELPTAAAVREAFEVASDKVRAFVTTCCTVLPTEGKATWDEGSTTTQLYEAFKLWTNDEGRVGLGKTKFAGRVASVPGVVAGRIGPKLARGWNLGIRARQSWDEAVSPTPPLAQLADLGQPYGHTETVVFSEPEIVSVLGAGRVRPTVPTVTSSRSATELLFETSASNSASRKCWDCGTEMSLIDLTWWACPSCNPATVASRPSWEGEGS